jgi:hypothetical protein
MNVHDSLENYYVKNTHNSFLVWSWDSVVSIVTRHGMGSPGLEPQWGKEVFFISILPDLP